MSKEPKYKILFGAIGAIGVLFAIFFGLFKFCTGRDSIKDPERTTTTTAAHVYEVGEIVDFGKWKWRVLDVQSNKALLITEDIIETRSYNDEYIEITWEKSALRTYLNGKFLEKFNALERAKIYKTESINWNNQWRGTNGGNNTMDKVFLLSIEEVVKYFGDSGQLKNQNPNSKYWINDEFNANRVAVFNGNEFWA